MVSEEKFIMSRSTKGQDGHLGWWIGPNTIDLVTCFLSSFIKLCSVFAEENLKMSQTIRGQDNHLSWWINTKNINLLEEDEDLLHVKFRQILFGNCRIEVKYQGVFVKHGICPRWQPKSKKAIFSTKVKVKVTRSLTLVSFERASLVEYACQIWSLYLLRFKSYSEG